MSFPPTDSPARLPRWPFPLLLLLLVSGLWLLDTHQPAPWADTSTPWFEQVRSVWPSSVSVDALNAGARFTPDLPIGSMIALQLTASMMLATLLAVEIPPLVALVVVLGVAATRSLWSTAAPGHDALAVGAVGAAVLAVAWPLGRRLATVVLAAGVAAAPPSVWLVVPAFVRLFASRRARAIVAVVLVALAACIQALLLRHAWTGLACVSSSPWTPAIGDVLVPGQSADASPWLAVRQSMAVLVGDVHAFGVLVAAFGVVRATDATRRLRLPTLVAVAVSLLAIGAGLVPPALGAALLLPWWAPWFAHGLVALVGHAPGPVRPLAGAFVILVALVSPILRNASVAAAPFVADMPHVADAASEAWRDAFIASERADLTRRLGRVGAVTVPADADTLARCLAGNRTVFALGPTVQHVEYLGYRIAERPLRAPLGAVLRDVRSNQLVALALAPEAAGWVGPGGLAMLPRLSLPRDVLVGAPAVGLAARTDRGGDRRAGRGGVDLVLQPGDSIGGEPLLAPLSVSARDGEVAIASAPERLAAGRHAALVVFDRAHAIALRTVGRASPGLPLPLMRHAAWRQVAVSGHPSCVAASPEWTPLSGAARRISVPTGAASASQPVLLYLASADRPTVGVTGLPTHPLWPAWTADAFDTRVAAEASRLRDQQERDAVPGPLRPRGAWVTRVAIAPRAAWDAPRVAVSAGVTPQGWLVRLASGGRRAGTTAVCPTASPGDRLLQGQYGVLDDESEREIALWATEGWHPAERLHGEVFQWTARPSATISFWLDAPADLTLAMDATGAGTASGPQPVVVTLNGQVLRADWQGVDRLLLPAAAVRAGDNTIALSVDRVVQPDRDPRSLGVLVKQLRIIGPARP